MVAESVKDPKRGMSSSITGSSPLRCRAWEWPSLRRKGGSMDRANSGHAEGIALASAPLRPLRPLTRMPQKRAGTGLGALFTGRGVHSVTSLPSGRRRSAAPPARAGPACRGPRNGKAHPGAEKRHRRLLAPAGGEPSDQAAVWGDGAADRGAALASRIGTAAKGNQVGRRRKETERCMRNPLK